MCVCVCVCVCVVLGVSAIKLNLGCVPWVIFLLFPVIGAVHRYYESRRRLFNDSQPSRLEKAQISKCNSKKLALRKQVNYNRVYCVCVSISM